MKSDFVDFENKLFQDLSKSYKKLIEQIKIHEFNNQEQLNLFIKKISMITCKMNNLNNDINNLYVDILENKIDLNKKEIEEINIEKKYQNTIKKLLPAFLIYSMFDNE
jgi:hypothetical protein